MINDLKTYVDYEKIENWNLRAYVEFDLEPVVSFISSWISLNYVYSTYALVLKDEFINWGALSNGSHRKGDKAELEFFANSPLVSELLIVLKQSKSYEVELPIKGVLYGTYVPDETTRKVNVLELDAVDLFLVVYQVRNNLFHGSKDPLKSDRDENLCKVLAQFLIDFMKLIEQELKE
ncbi:hypothetical protein [Vibrio fortis]|uniref:hypothetical protein n=1 Tax=Vibrio fortis TaxID=212667 RepID=UPI0038CD3B26